MNDRLDRLESAAEKTVRLLAEQHDINVVIGTRALYNGGSKTLEVPAFERMTPDTRLANAWRGIIDHECAHAVYTEFDKVDRLKMVPQAERSRVHALWNCFEDLMIERRWVEPYPGSRRHFRDRDGWLYEHMGQVGQVTDPDFEARDVFGGGKQRVGEFGALLQGILAYGTGAELEEVHPTVRALLLKFRSEIDAGNSAKDTAEAVDAAMALWEALKDPPPPEEPEPPPPEAGEDDQQEEPDSGDGGEQDAVGPGSCQDSGSESENSEEPGADGPDGGESSEGEPKGQGGGASGEPEEEPGEAQLSQGMGQGSGEPQEGHGEEGQVGSVGEYRDSAEKGDAEAGGGAGGMAGAEVERLVGQAIESVKTGAFVNLTESGKKLVIGQVVNDGGKRALPYTVHPVAAANDRWNKHSTPTPAGEILRRTATAATRQLTNGVASAIMASRRSMKVGGVEEGTELDPMALVDIASRSGTRAIYETEVREVTKSTFVGMLVDCSGSMGDNDVNSTVCPEHGYVVDPRMTSDQKYCPTCKQPKVASLTNGSHYATIASSALHDALVASRVPHAVLGYNTRGIVNSDPSGNPYNGDFKRWSRFETAVDIHEFIPAPGLHDRGHGLGYITGNGANGDGDAVFKAAKYFAKHSRGLDRCIMIVITDGLPSGYDDYGMNQPHLCYAVDRVAASGIEVYGIGVQISDERFFRQLYPTTKGTASRGATGAILLDDAKGLSSAVIKALIDLVSEGYGTSRRVG